MADQFYPGNEPPFDPAPDFEPRCEVCGWPLASSLELGCVAGNCSQRPRPSPTWAEQLAEADRIDRDWEGIMLTYTEQDFPTSQPYERTIPGWRCRHCNRKIGTAGLPPKVCGCRVTSVSRADGDAND